MRKPWVVIMILESWHWLNAKYRMTKIKWNHKNRNGIAKGGSCRILKAQ